MSDKKLLKNCPLKNCPFCGGKAETYEYESSRDIYDSDTLGYVDTEYFTKYGVGCTLCGCIVAEKNSEEEAIKAWNTKKPMERIVERLEELQEEYMYPDDDDYIVGQYDGVREALTVVLEEGGLNE